MTGTNYLLILFKLSAFAHHSGHWIYMRVGRQSPGVWSFHTLEQRVLTVLNKDICKAAAGQETDLLL